MTPSGTPVDVPAIYRPWFAPALGVDAEALTRRAQDALSRAGASPSVSDTGSHLLEAILATAQEAGHDNWDGEGSAAVDAAAADYAMQFVRALPGDVPLPTVWADADGDIAFDWQQSVEQLFSVRVARDGTLNFAGLFGTSKLHGVDTLQTTLPIPILDGIRRAIQ